MKYLVDVELSLRCKWNADIVRNIMYFLRVDVRKNLEAHLQKPKPYFVRRKHITDGVWYILRLPSEYRLYHVYFNNGRIVESEGSTIDPNTWLTRVLNHLG